jgi:DNA-binding response OmpR family regulator
LAVLPAQVYPSDMLDLSDCTVDLATGHLRRTSGQEDCLSTAERRLLSYLAQRPSTDISRDDLLTELWGYSDLTMRYPFTGFCA